MSQIAPPPEFFRAIKQRDSLRAKTNALRLIDGDGDGRIFAGLFIDDFADRWLVSTTGAPPPAWLRSFAESGSPAAPRSIYWKVLDRAEKESPAHWVGETVTSRFVVEENGARYWIDFAAGYSQGIFLDQRQNRVVVREFVKGGMTLLNCFAYTCAFSVAAAVNGSRTVSVDLSKRSLDWGRDNLALNVAHGVRLTADSHLFFAGDVFDVLRRLGRQGRRFECVVLDPPTFSRNRKGQIFRFERDFKALVASAVPLLTPGGRMLCATNMRRLPASTFRRLIADGMAGQSGAWNTEFCSMPPDFCGEQYLQSCWILAPGTLPLDAQAALG